MAGPKSDKIWADAVRRAVHRRLENVEGKPKKLEHLADKLVDSGLEGDMTAIKEIGDRLDGKPKQVNENKNEHDFSDPIVEMFKQIAENSGRIGKD